MGSFYVRRGGEEIRSLLNGPAWPVCGSIVNVFCIHSDGGDYGDYNITKHERTEIDEHSR